MRQEELSSDRTEESPEVERSDSREESSVLERSDSREEFPEVESSDRTEEFPPGVCELSVYQPRYSPKAEAK